VFGVQPDERLEQCQRLVFVAAAIGKHGEVVERLGIEASTHRLQQQRVSGRRVAAGGKVG
jgi:hypothetical protein